MIPDTDLFLYDIKLMDNDAHKKYTGVDGGVVLENLKRLAEKKAHVDIRVPIIPDITDKDENLDAIMDFLLSLNGIRNVGLLPYNRLGHEKYKRLNMMNSMVGIPTPSKQRMEEIKMKFDRRGFHARIGG
jgi:pyruvate formate lyase activating enzyme